MDGSADWVLARWSLLSRLRAGDKLSIQGDTVNIDKSSFFMGLKRSARGDTREALLSWIPQLVSSTKESFESFFIESYHDKMIQRGIRGLLTLRETYQSDVSFISKLEVCLDKIRCLSTIVCLDDIAYFHQNQNEE